MKRNQTKGCDVSGYVRKVEGGEGLTMGELRKISYDGVVWWCQDAKNLNGGGDWWCEGNIVNDGIDGFGKIKFFVLALEVEMVDIGGSVSARQEMVDEGAEEERVVVEGGGVEVEDGKGSPNVPPPLTQNARLKRCFCVQR